MHTFQGKTCTISHNGDFSGEVIVRVESGKNFAVDFQDLKEFVALWVRRNDIAKLENASADDVLHRTWQT